MGQLLEQGDRIEQRVNELYERRASEQEYLNVDQALLYLQIAKSTLYNKVHKKEVPYYKFKGSLRFKMDELRQYMEGGRVGTMEEEEGKWEEMADELFINQKRNR